jgi:hypothetical protein
VIAPALIIGLRGRRVRESRLSSLNASPDGSTSIRASTASKPRVSSARAYAKILAIDWMVNGTSTAPYA